MLTCSKCGADAPIEGQRFCLKCGAELPKDEVPAAQTQDSAVPPYCGQCGARTSIAGQVFCLKCGAKLIAAQSISQSSTPLSAHSSPQMMEQFVPASANFGQSPVSMTQQSAAAARSVTSAQSPAMPQPQVQSQEMPQSLTMPQSAGQQSQPQYQTVPPNMQSQQSQQSQPQFKPPTQQYGGPQPQPQPQYIYVQQPTSTFTPKGYIKTNRDYTLRLIASIVDIVFCAGYGLLGLTGFTEVGASSILFLICLAWMIPMTLYGWKISTGEKPNTTTFAVCTLIFVNLVSGILLLMSDKDE